MAIDPRIPESLVWRRISAGVYDSADGRVTLYRIEGCNPPAWNVEWTIDFQNALVATDPDYSRAALALSSIVDGAASYRDAKALAATAWPALCDRLRERFATVGSIDVSAIEARWRSENPQWPAASPVSVFDLACQARDEEVLRRGRCLLGKEPVDLTQADEDRLMDSVPPLDKYEDAIRSSTSGAQIVEPAGWVCRHGNGPEATEAEAIAACPECSPPIHVRCETCGYECPQFNGWAFCGPCRTPGQPSLYHRFKLVEGSVG